MSLWPKLVRYARIGSIPNCFSVSHRLIEAVTAGRAVVKREVAKRSCEPRLALVQTVALDTRRRVSMLRCGEQHLLVMTGGASDVVIGWLPVEPAIPAPAS